MLRDARTSRNVFGLCALLALANGAQAESIGPLLATIGQAARFAVPARATVTVSGAGAALDFRFAARGHRLVIEGPAGFRALLHPGKIVVAERGRIHEAPLGAALPGTDILLEDIAPFHGRYFKVPQMSDDGPAGIVVTGAPAAPSVYPLLVITIDRERQAISRVQYYRDNVSNLVKIRRTLGWTVLSGRSRPATLTMEDFRAGTTTQLALDWREAPDLAPAAFGLAALRTPSP